jgi:hypothetical protein
MKIKFILMILLFCSCSNNKFQGHVYDYDTERPLKNVYIKINDDITQTDSAGYFTLKIKSNSTIEVFLKRKGYASKKLFRKRDSSGEFSKKSLKENTIYLYNKESDFFNKR